MCYYFTWFIVFIKPIHASHVFPYALKPSENLWFSEVFMEYRKRPKAWNGLEVIQKVRHSGSGEGGWRIKSGKKWHRSNKVQVKLFWVHFFCNLFLLLCIWKEFGSRTVANNRNTYNRLFEVQNYNSTVLSTWLINTCVSICKIECAHKLKL